MTAEGVVYSQDVARVTAPDLEPFFAGWRVRPTPEERLAILRAAHGAVLAWSGERLVGFVTAISDGVSWAYVTLLEVVPDARGRGIGTAVMERILERYRDLYGFDLNCDDDLVPFYERLGLRRLNGMIRRNDAAFPLGRPV